MSSRRYTTEFVIKGDSTSAVQASRELQRANADMTKEMQRAERQGEQMTQSFESVTMHAQRLAAVSGAVAAAVGTMSVSQTRNIAEQAALARSVGVTVQTLQQWEFAAQAVNLGAGKMGDIFKDTAEKIGDFVATGGGEAADLFERLNLNINELMGMSPDQQLLAIGEALDGVATQGEKIFFMESLANDASRLIPLMENNAELLREQIGLADQLGVSLPQSDIDSIEQANQALDELVAIGTSFSSQVAADMAESFVSISAGAKQLVSDMGGMGEVVDRAADVTLLLAAATGGRLAAAIGVTTVKIWEYIAADRAARVADATATTAAAARTRETLRIAQSEQLAAQRAFENSRATAAATGNTTLRTKAITQLAAANQRAIAAEAAHTAAVNTSSAAMARGTVAAQGMAYATRAGAGALALVGGPAGAAVLAAGAIYYFREELGLVTPKVQSATDRVDDMTSALDANSEAALKNAKAMLEAERQFQQFRQATLVMDVSQQRQIVADEQRQWDAVGGQQAFGMGQRSESQQALHDLQVELMNTRNAIEAAGGSVTEIDEKLAELESTTRETTLSTLGTSEANKSAEKAAREAAAAAEAQATALVGIQQEMEPLLKDHETYIERLGVLDKALAEGTISEEEYGKALRWNAEQYTRAATGAEDYEKQTESLISTYDSHNQKARQLRDALAQINQMYRAGEIDGDQYTRMVAGVRDEMRQLALEADPVAQEKARAWEEASNRIDETFADAFAGAFDSFDDFGDQLLDGFKRLLAELAYQATLKPIVVAFTGNMQSLLGMGGGGSIPGMGGGGLGGLNFNSIGSLGKTVSGWFGGGAAAAGGAPVGYAGGFGAQAATGTYTGWAGSAAAGAANPGMFASMGGWSGIAGGLGAGYAGMQLGNQIAPDAKYGDIAGGLGAVGGFMLGGPIGSAIGGAIGASISKGLFGGTWQTKDGGLNLGVAGGGITGNQYTHQRKSGGLFSGSSYRTKTSTLDGSFEGALSEAYNAQEASLALTLDVLGQQSSALNSFSTGLTKISTKGKSEAEVEQAVQDWLQNVVNRAARSVVNPAEFALAGETTVETLNRLATALTGVNPILEQLHGNAFAASLAGGDAAASLVALSGGMEQFAQRADYYYANFYSEAERQEAAMTQAAKAMGAFTARTGEIVTTTDDLRALVDGIDRNSVAGRELYAAAMQLAPALVEVENGLERVRDRFSDMLNEAENALGNAEQQARSAFAAFDGQAYDQQRQLLALLGDSEAALAMERERELEGIDPLLHETQRRIWAMEDETAAQMDATQAAQNYVSELSRVRDELSNTLGGINQWIDQRNATSQTPGLNLAEAGEQFARQLVLAESGDRSALQSITQYADQYLSAGEAMFASGGAFQSIQEDVLGALKDLPDQISAEEYLAEEIRAALFDALEGKATDSEINALMARVMDGDLSIESALASIYGTSEGTEGNTENLEDRARDHLDSLNGLVSEMTRTTDQFVGLNSGITSLTQSINALGVAQEEIVRIEKERAAAEQAERERIERERLEAQRGSLQSEIERLLQQQSSLSSVGVSAPDSGVIDSSYEHVPDAVNNINRIASNILGSSGVTDRSAERLRDYYTKGAGFTADQGVGDAPGPGGAYSPGGLYWPYVKAYIDEIEGAVDTRQSATGLSGQIAELQARLNEMPTVNGSHADGNWSVGFDGYIAELHKDEMVVPARTANMLRDLPGRSLPMPDMPLPHFPALGQNDVLQVLQDVRRELVETRKQNQRLQEENNRHAAAAVSVQQEGFKQQISEQRKGNAALDDMSAAARLEASR